MSGISVVLPTRNRPDNLRRLSGSILKTTNVSPEIIVYIDEDDKISVQVAEELEFKYVIGPRRGLSACWNVAAEKASHEILMFGSDDIVFRKNNWDEEVVKKFNEVEDKILFVTSWDGHEPGDLGTHGFLHRNWINAVGYFLPPYFHSICVDNWINDVAAAIKRKVYMPYVIAEHFHYTHGNAVEDLTYSDARIKYENDRVTYEQTLEERFGDVKKLRQVMNRKDGRQKIVINNTEIREVEVPISCLEEQLIIKNATLW